MLDRRRLAPPLWAQVMNNLQANVIAPLPRGEAIPSEGELQARYGVSRVVIRRAVDELCRLGVLRKEQGRGTFVSHTPVEDVIGHISSWTSLVTRSGYAASTGARAVDLVAVPPHLRAVFGAEVERTVRLRRTRLIDGRPATLAVGYIPSDLVRDVSVFERTESMYEGMGLLGIVLVRAQQVIRARAATEAEAEALEVHPGYPLIQVERVAYNAAGRAVSFDVTTSRGDVVQYRAELHRLDGAEGSGA